MRWRRVRDAFGNIASHILGRAVLAATAEIPA